MAIGTEPNVIRYFRVLIRGIAGQSRCDNTGRPFARFVGNLSAALAEDQTIGLLGQLSQVSVYDRGHQRPLSHYALFNPRCRAAKHIGKFIRILPRDQIAIGRQPHGLDEVQLRRRIIKHVGLLSAAQPAGGRNADRFVDVARVVERQLLQYAADALRQRHALRHRRQRRQEQKCAQVGVRADGLLGCPNRIPHRAANTQLGRLPQNRTDHDRAVDEIQVADVVEVRPAMDVARLRGRHLPHASQRGGGACIAGQSNSLRTRACYGSTSLASLAAGLAAPASELVLRSRNADTIASASSGASSTTQCPTSARAVDFGLRPRRDKPLQTIGPKAPVAHPPDQTGGPIRQRRQAALDLGQRLPRGVLRAAGDIAHESITRPAGSTRCRRARYTRPRPPVPDFARRASVIRSAARLNKLPPCTANRPNHRQAARAYPPRNVSRRKRARVEQHDPFQPLRHPQHRAEPDRPAPILSDQCHAIEVELQTSAHRFAT